MPGCVITHLHEVGIMYATKAIHALVDGCSNPGGSEIFWPYEDIGSCKKLVRRP